MSNTGDMACRHSRLNKPISDPGDRPIRVCQDCGSLVDEDTWLKLRGIGENPMPPAKSRVREMAEEMCSSDVFGAERLMRAAVEAVGEWLRNHASAGAAWQADVRSAFLGPRR